MIFYTDFNTLCLLERTNEDTTQDRTSYGKKLLDVCKTNYVLIYNGRLGKGRGAGKASTTVDYMIGLWDLTRYVTNFDVLDFDPLFPNVHCRFHAELQFYRSAVNPGVTCTQKENIQERPRRWKAVKKDDYKSNVYVSKVNDPPLRIEELSVEEVNKR